MRINHNRQTMRWQSWDYGNDGMYFITICTKNRESFFGKITGGIMHLSPIGKIANEIWKKIPIEFPFIELDEFVVMPDHIHGILKINRSGSGSRAMGNPRDNPRDNPRAAINRGPGGWPGGWPGGPLSVSVPDSSPGAAINRGHGSNRKKGERGGITGEKNPMLWENISRVIRWYKGRVTFEARKIDPDFGWQSLFFVLILWTMRSLYRVRKYIIENPKKWKKKK